MQLEPDTPHDVPRARSRRAGDRGFSIVEVVVSIALMGTVVVALLQAVQQSIRASSVSRDSAQVETVVVNAADRVNRAPVRCDIDGYKEYVVAAVRSQGWWTGEGQYAQAADVKHWFYDPAEPTKWRQGVCPADDFGKRVIQKVSITITSPDRHVSRTIEVVKSDV